MHELLDLHQFLNHPDLTDAGIFDNDREWNKLDEYAKKLVEARALADDTIDRNEIPEISSTTQTQNLIAAQWKSEFETPRIEKTIRLPASPYSPNLFGGTNEMEEYDFLDDDALCAIPSQQISFSLTRKNPTLVDHCGIFQNEEVNSINPLELPIIAFSTASGKKMKPPSEAAIAKSKALLGLDDLDNNLLDPAVGFKELTNSPFKPLEKNINPLIETLRKVDDFDGDISSPAISFAKESVGFSTASGKKMKQPSEAAIAKSKELLGLDDLDNNLLDPMMDSSTASVGFSTASGKKMKQPSEAAIAKSKILLDFDEFKEPLVAPVTSLFSTASGKKIDQPSEAAIAKSKTLLEFDNFDENPAPEAQPITTSFNTASGKRLKSPSKTAMQKAMKILSTIEDFEPEVEKKMSNSSIPSGSLFATASGKIVKSPSKASIQKANNIMRSMEEPKRIIPKSPISSIPRSMARSPLGNLKKVIPPRRPSIIASSKPVAIQVAPITKPENRQKLSGLKSLIFGQATQSAVSLLDFDPLLLMKQSKPQFPLASEIWFKNHSFFILWKMLSYRTRLHDHHYNVSLSSNASYFIDQLGYRYYKEFMLTHRSILKRIVERDESSSCYMVLFVSGLEKISDDQVKLMLSDGWYELETTHDPKVARFINKKRIVVGTKLKVSMAQLVSDEACDILEAVNRGVKLKIFGNGIAPARWDANLGKQRKATFTVPISSIDPHGGTVPCIDAYIIRVYPTKYVAEFESGQQKQMTKEEIPLDEPTEDEKRDRLISIRPIVRIMIEDACGSVQNSRATVTLWDCNYDVLKKFEEGARIRILALRPSLQRKDTKRLNNTHDSNEIGDGAVMLTGSKMTRLIFLGEKRLNCLFDLVKNLPENLVVWKNYDIYGQLLFADDSDHCWMLADGVGMKLVAVKVTKKQKQSLLSDGIVSMFCLLDVAYQYNDPRHGFPVFSSIDTSRLITDEASLRSYGLSCKIERSNDDLASIKAKIREITGALLF